MQNAMRGNGTDGVERGTHGNESEIEGSLACGNGEDGGNECEERRWIKCDRDCRNDCFEKGHRWNECPLRWTMKEKKVAGRGRLSSNSGATKQNTGV